MPLESSNAYRSLQKIKVVKPGFQPKVAIVLGSGLGSFADCLEDSTIIPYEALYGFPSSDVPGHAGKLVLGYLDGTAVICLQGRAHSYEGNMGEIVKTYVRTLRLLGVEYFIATNASGSLREDVGPGELMLITDHINLQPTNPLVGPNNDAFGPRFYPLDNAYDSSIRSQFLAIAQETHIKLNTGVYIAVLGPHYETAAEIRAFKILGADAVGMSTVPEVLVANHCGMKVGVIAVISNYATGLSTQSHDHESVVMTASRAGASLNQLLKRFVITCPV